MLVCLRNVELYRGDLSRTKVMEDKRRCGHPAVPPNARVSLSNSDIVPGTLATYECDEGYELFGGHQKECTVRGDWKGDSPFCGT
ncbi:unnamed protein product [Pieris macdunnoughi]|uniref:Sushi domain-containing protein n=1 Tax=Pieris macdunnoughi TaxID=345717 RepID=A0A821W587_9NEOP|nr:unnamed protein product [Pieris macdunnoughi]